ncbi:MAG: Rrf2 family transcriptional regulator [Cytophagaceae bacterium]|nr:Rrf2 family transcriptional regulator [Cytophagaceae bacterium]MDW8455920.1 Rrf2 family transcriptional regulator [Cytophagaceae bacterium]
MLSKKCKYALKTLVYLAKCKKGDVVKTVDIANHENIPKKFLEQILISLKRAGYVASRQGNVGGYYLLTPANKITIAEIYRLFEGAIALVPCVSLNFYQPCDDCDNEKKCELKKFFIKLRDQNLKIMEKQTIESLVKMQDN